MEEKSEISEFRSECGPGGRTSEGPHKFFVSSIPVDDTEKLPLENNRSGAFRGQTRYVYHS